MHERVPIVEILRSTTRSCDFGRVPTDPNEAADWWLNVIEEKSSDPGFSDLVDSILEHGFYEESAIGFDRDYISEGHHRLVAAILLCMDDVPATYYGLNASPTGEYISAHGSGWDASVNFLAN